MATPILRVLARQFDRPSVLVPCHVQEMLKEDSKGIEFLIPGLSKGAGSVWRESLRLRRMKFQTALLVNRSIRSAIVARLAGIPKRVGHNTEHRGLLLTTRVPYSWTAFEATSYGDLVEAMGIPGDYTRVSLTVTEQELRRGKESARGATIGVQPGASFSAKAIPLDKLAVVVNAIQGMGHTVAMLGGKEEALFGSQLQALVGKPMIDLIGKCELRESMGVLAGLRASIGASTGIMHIAAAVGCPTVTVFGKTLSSKWGHNYHPHQSIQIPSGKMADTDPAEILNAAMRALDAYGEMGIGHREI